MILEGRVAIVTGASRGIGLATARALFNENVKVVLVARSTDKLRRLSSELPGSLAVPADMTRPEQITSMVKSVKEHFGRIDILINNAGQGYDAPIERTNIATLRKIFELDFVGPLVAMREVIPIMKKQGGGSIVNISSGTALMHLPNMGNYAAIKAAIAHLSLTAREELKPHHINVSVVYPYITLTDFEENTIKDMPEDNQAEDGRDYEPPKPDSARYVAELIVRCIKNNEAEAFAHAWMKHGA